MDVQIKAGVAEGFAAAVTAVVFVTPSIRISANVVTHFVAPVLSVVSVGGSSIHAIPAPHAFTEKEELALVAA